MIDITDKLAKALEPFAALFQKYEDRYRKRGGNSDVFKDTHPSFDLDARELRLGAWRACRNALAAYAEQKALMVAPDRCPICDWPFAKDRKEGCVPGDCSYRPEENSQEWHRIKQRRAQLMAAPPFKFVLNQESLEKAAREISPIFGESPDTICSQFVDSQWKPVGPLWKVEHLPIARIAIAAYMEAEHAAGRAWQPMGEHDVLILRLPEGE